MDQLLARHIRDTYGIPVIQWLEGWSDPLPPSPGLMADGRAFDYYFFQYPDFRKHLMKFVALDKPADFVGREQASAAVRHELCVPLTKPKGKR